MDKCCECGKETDDLDWGAPSEGDTPVGFCPSCVKDIQHRRFSRAEEIIYRPWLDPPAFIRTLRRQDKTAIAMLRKP